MPRPSTYSASSIATFLREHARRRLTPEAAAAEIGLSLSSYRRYLAAAGGRVGKARVVLMPAPQGDAKEVFDGDDAAPTTRAAFPGREGGDAHAGTGDSQILSAESRDR